MDNSQAIHGHLVFAIVHEVFELILHAFFHVVGNRVAAVQSEEADMLQVLDVDV